MKTSKTLTFAPLFLSVVASANVYEPRRLTPEEAKVNPLLPIDDLLTPKNYSEDTNIEKQVLKHVPKGLNKDKGWKDAIRMPGTNWCGKGWRADNPLDIGGYAGADRCCRHHDLGCPISIEPGATEYGLTNPRIHTVMHCSCDERFRSCLKMARTQAADIVGNLFFNIIDIPCFVFSKQRVSEKNHECGVYFDIHFWLRNPKKISFIIQNLF